jgi:hypothetical protein
VATAYFKYYTDILLEELKKATENLSQDSWFLDHDFKPVPLQYKAVLIT